LRVAAVNVSAAIAKGVRQMIVSFRHCAGAPGTESDVSYWHFGDIARSRMDFRCRGKNGHAVDITAMTDLGPAVVMDRVGIPQCSDLPAARCLRRFRTIKVSPKDLAPRWRHSAA
jgi:hypothetical protein